MIRKIAVGVAATAVAAAGLAVSGGGVAHAASATITNVTSANVTCSITAKATLAPALKNNWVKAEHAADPVQAVKDLPNTQFAALNAANSTSAKSKGSCTGTVTGTHPAVKGVTTSTMTATSIKIGLATTTQAIDNPPLNNNGGSTCTGLLAGTAGEDVGAKYTSTITLKGSGAKLPVFTISGSTVQPAGLGFSITGGVASAPFGAGTTGVSQANADGATIAAVVAGPATSANPKPTSKCQASLKVKTKKDVTTAELKAPKGFSKLTIGSGTFDLDK